MKNPLTLVPRSDLHLKTSWGLAAIPNYNGRKKEKEIPSILHFLRSFELAAKSLHNMDGTAETSSSSEVGGLLSSLSFKGPVSQAILLAQTWKKILLVYIAGVDEVSIHLEQSTWEGSKLVTLLAEHCVVLHLLPGSADAFHFSAIYPHKSAPAISAIGYNGFLLWQHEGSISSEDLVAKVEAAQTVLSLQEATAASVMAAALTASTQEPASNVSSLKVAASEHEGITNAVEAASSVDEMPAHQSLRNEPTCDPTCETADADRQEDVASASIVVASPMPSRLSSTSSSEYNIIGGPVEPSSSIGEIDEMISNPTCETAQPEKSAAALGFDFTRNSFQVGNEGTSDHVNHNEGEILEADNEVFREQSKEVANCGIDQGIMEIAPKGETDYQGSCLVKDDDSVRKLPNREFDSILLQIRLLNGLSLQAKFGASDTLKIVKDFVSENRTDGNRSFSLAIPYPRKVFSEEDMSKKLSELNLGNRAAIILVPHQYATDLFALRSSLQGNNVVVPGSSDNAREAGPGLFWRVLSYINPLSYIGWRSSNQESTSRDSLWQYGPNPSLQSTWREGDKNSIPTSKSNISVEGGKVGNGRGSSKVEKKSWGSNIHTLKHDEDESFHDRNAFWNGNSTEFGGDDSRRD